MTETVVPRPPSRRTRLGWVALGLGLAVLAAVVWVVTAPRTLGAAFDSVVRYPGLDDPRAQVQGLYALITAVTGVLTGIVVLGPGERGLARRTVVLILAGLPLAGLTYLVGFLLGPPTEAAQLAAGAEEIQVPLLLSTPLLVLIWPMMTALVVAVGLLISMIYSPPRRLPELDWDSRGADQS